MRAIRIFPHLKMRNLILFPDLLVVELSFPYFSIKKPKPLKQTMNDLCDKLVFVVFWFFLGSVAMALAVSVGFSTYN